MDGAGEAAGFVVGEQLVVARGFFGGERAPEGTLAERRDELSRTAGVLIGGAASTDTGSGSLSGFI